MEPMTDERQLTPEQAYYEQPALWAEGALGAQDEERVATLAAKLPPSARTLLDAGCGNGLFLRHLARSPRKWDRLVGADRSRAALRHVVVETVEASVDALPFRDGEFDVVTCFEVLEHLPLATYARALSELARVARTHVLVCVPHDEDLRHGLSTCPSCFTKFSVTYHMREFREPDMRALPLPGFTCEEVFKLGVVKVLSPWASRFHRIATAIRREPPLPDHAVCPMCGFHPPVRSSATDRPPPARLGARLRAAASGALPRVDAHRWIAARYVRG